LPHAERGAGSIDLVAGVGSLPAIQVRRLGCSHACVGAQRQHTDVLWCRAAALLPRGRGALGLCAAATAWRCCVVWLPRPSPRTGHLLWPGAAGPGRLPGRLRLRQPGRCAVCAAGPVVAVPQP
jgi:hypothetical protein